MFMAMLIVLYTVFIRKLCNLGEIANFYVK